jgi:hypothetical protein
MDDEVDHLTADQLAYIKAQVNQADPKRFTFLFATPTANGHKLAVVTTFANGDLHDAVATVDDGTLLWQEDKAQLAKMVAKVCRQLKGV